MRNNLRTPAVVRGVSLFEIILAISVAGILSAMAIARIDVAKMQVNSMVQVLSTSMVAAQREAVTKQHDVILTFDDANSTIRMVWDRNNNSLIDNGERSRAIPLDTRVTFGRGGAPARAFGTQPINFNRVVAGLPALIFHRNGSASGIGGFYLTTVRAEAAAGYATDTRAVEIVRATGRTEWLRYSGTAWVRGF